jgi:phage-related protein (TIGR01555 family)
MIKRFLSLFAKPVPAPKVPAPAVAKISPVVLALAKQAPPKVEIAPYEPPAGVIPAALAMDSMAMDATPYDWVNSVYSGHHFKGYPHLALLSQQPEYRKMAETIAKQMTRKWIKVKAKGEADKSERVTQMEESLEEFNVRAIFRKAAELDGLFGRGQIYIDVKTPGGIPAQADPEELKTPLLRSPAKIKKDSLIGFRVVEPVWTYPSSYNSDNPLAADYYKPTAWFVMGKTVHASRMMMFASREVPDLLKASYNFGGLSMSQLAEPYVNNWLRTRDSVSDMVHSFSVSGIKTNMGAALSGSTDSSMLDRATLFNAMRDNRGVFMLDRDTEEFFQFNTPLSGLDALQAQAQEQMSSVSNIPLVFLLGIAPSGLNATSEGEIKVFHSYIMSMQEALFTDPLNLVFDIIQLSKFGAIDPDITFEFAPLDEMDPLQQAQIRAADASTDAVLIGAGAISADDSRARLAADPASLYAGLEINEDLGGPDGLSAQDKNLTFDGEHWITVSGARVLIDENGEVIGGAGGKLDGKTMHPNSKSENRINEKTSAFKDPDFKPHESEKPATKSNAGKKMPDSYWKTVNEGGGGYVKRETASRSKDEVEFDLKDVERDLTSAKIDASYKDGEDGTANKVERLEKRVAELKAELGSDPVKTEVPAAAKSLEPASVVAVATTPAQKAAAQTQARMIAGKRRTHADAVKFAKAALSGSGKENFLNSVKKAFPELY